MSKLTSISFLLFASLQVVAANPKLNGADNAKPADCCDIVSEALDAVAAITKNMSRSDVEKEFMQEGGLFSRSETTYVYKRCSLIKIKVSFSLDSNYSGFADGSPLDSVIAVSKPYIELPIKD